MHGLEAEAVAVRKINAAATVNLDMVPGGYYYHGWKSISILGSVGNFDSFILQPVNNYGNLPFNHFPPLPEISTCYSVIMERIDLCFAPCNVELHFCC